MKTYLAKIDYPGHTGYILVEAENKAEATKKVDAYFCGGMSFEVLDTVK